MAQTRWSQAVKRAARRLAADDDLTVAEIGERLKSDHGANVPRSTLAAWLARPDAETITSDPSVEIRRQASRVLAITSAEIRRLERGNGRPDLTRLERLARILRSLEVGQGSRRKPDEPRRARTLLDLSSEGEAMNGAASGEAIESPI